jgi:hypothetical protein
MAEKAKASREKVGSGKAAVPANATAKKRVNKGESMVCEVCGLSVVVEEVGGIAVEQDSVLLCCGKQMKTGKASAKAKAAK